VNQAAPPAYFQAEVDRVMKKAGIEGRPATVWLAGGALRITGGKGGEMSVPLGRVERMRIGGMLTKVGRLYEFRLWRNGDNVPLRVTAVRPYLGYAEVTRELAGEIARLRGLAALTRGAGLGDALVYVGFGLACLGFAAGTVLGIAAEPQIWLQAPAWLIWVALIVLPAAFLFLGLLVLREVARVYWPAPLRSLAEIDRQLPKGSEDR
jgi:hypothetical protein